MMLAVADPDPVFTYGRIRIRTLSQNSSKSLSIDFLKESIGNLKDGQKKLYVNFCIIERFEEIQSNVKIYTKHKWTCEQ